MTLDILDCMFGLRNNRPYKTARIAAYSARSRPKAAAPVLEMNDMVIAANDFTGGVRFDKSDVESLIELWDEYSEFGGESDEDDIDFDAILSDSE